MTTRYPRLTGANAGGRFIENAHAESCGGRRRSSLEVVQLGLHRPDGGRLTSARGGWGWPSASASTDRRAGAAASIPKQLASVEGLRHLGIGQAGGTSLNMAVVAATDHRRRRTPAAPDGPGGAPAGSVRATSPRIAALVTRLMESVVRARGDRNGGADRRGQGRGETGTSELGGNEENDTWPLAFAPAQRPKLAVVLLVARRPRRARR